MRRGLKPPASAQSWLWLTVPRARPPMRRGLKLTVTSILPRAVVAARAAPYEKGTETNDGTHLTYSLSGRARGPL